MSKRKYRYRDRAAAEAALEEEEYRHRRTFWFAAALAENRITWTRRKQGYRFGCFVPVPGRSGYVLVVEDFNPPGNGMPQYAIHDRAQFTDRQAQIYQEGNSPEVNAWLQGADEIRKDMRLRESQA